MFWILFILSVFFLGLLLYPILNRWLDSAGAGTLATFVSFAGACGIFVFRYLPPEFVLVARFFGVLMITALIFLFLARRRAPSKHEDLLDEEARALDKFSQDGGSLL